MLDEEIYDFARALAGEGQGETTLRALCAAASGELRARLREGVAPEEIRADFVTATGLLALSLAVAAEGNVSAFEAGSLSVRFGDGPLSAARLRERAEALLGAYLRDEGFAFVGVAG